MDNSVQQCDDWLYGRSLVAGYMDQQLGMAVQGPRFAVYVRS